MAIHITKKVKGIDHSLYITTTINIGDGTKVLIKQMGYTSKEHYDEGFTPVMIKEHVINNPGKIEEIITALKASEGNATNLVETFLVDNIPFYNGGVVE